jgi:hypothetical protein
MNNDAQSAILFGRMTHHVTAAAKLMHSNLKRLHLKIYLASELMP